ncbi:hypothetical protein D9M68_807410 [compost metagenome]
MPCLRRQARGRRGGPLRFGRDLGLGGRVQALAQGRFFFLVERIGPGHAQQLSPDQLALLQHGRPALGPLQVHGLAEGVLLQFQVAVPHLQHRLRARGPQVAFGQPGHQQAQFVGPCFAQGGEQLVEAAAQIGAGGQPPPVPGAPGAIEFGAPQGPIGQ